MMQYLLLNAVCRLLFAVAVAVPGVVAVFHAIMVVMRLFLYSSVSPPPLPHVRRALLWRVRDVVVALNAVLPPMCWMTLDLGLWYCRCHPGRINKL